MLPPGHFAAGYLTAKATASLLVNYWPQAAEFRYLAFGTIVSVLVDLDMLFTVFKLRRVITGTKEENHRKYLTHVPIIHLLLAFIVFFIGFALNRQDLQIYSVFYLVGTWTHFAFDSFSYGIQWVWPFKKQLYAFSSPGVDSKFDYTSTLDFWKKFLVTYTKNFVFYLEFVLIIVAIIAYIKY